MIQIIGADLGRGYTKGYSEYEGEALSCLFKSVVGDGRSIDYKEYDKPIHIEVDGEEIFAGELAEKESFNSIPNFSDDKTTATAKKLLYVLLDQVAKSQSVKICLGVPNKIFNETTLQKVKEEYLGKTIEIKNSISNTIKKVNIVDIIIAREADAAMLYTINTHPKRLELTNKKLGMATIGFRTTELSFFDQGIKFVDKSSKTIELGNRTILDIIQKQLQAKGIMKELNEIDSSTDYDKIKKALYNNLLEKLNQQVEMDWINWAEMDIFLAGGTSLKFENIPSKFEKVEDPQMVTAKGLHYIAERRFR